MKELEAAGRPATAEDRAVLARWSSWGALPQLFDKDDWAAERAELQAALSEAEYAAAARTTTNAYYTDAALVQEMWSAVRELGFKGGNVLEPGSGAGTFIGFAPESASMVGIELDPLTAKISQHLYPDAQIRNESFADTRITRNSFDLTVGNVPFSPNSLYDKVYNHDQRHSMHNHFILKSLEATKPGGFVAVLSSSFTMDAANPGSRREMNDLADLVGAVRLPNGAHRRAAGTEALTDVLLFRKREPGREPLSRDWEQVTNIIANGKNVKINTWFDLHPEHVLGQITVGNGMYGDETVSVRASELADVPGQLGASLAAIVQDAERLGLMHTPQEADSEVRPAALLPQSQAAWDGTISALADGTFTIVDQGQQVPFDFPKAHAAELRALLGLRDAARELLEMEAANTDDTPEMDQLRASLSAQYTAYVDRYGPVNRYQLMSREDKKTGDVTTWRKLAPAVQKLQSNDPFGSLPAALEDFNDETQIALPAALTERRQVLVRRAPRGAENAEDALAIALDTVGRADLPFMADLLGKTEAEARAELSGLVYDDPTTGKLLPAAEYLSGNVRTRLDQAREALALNAKWQENVDALEHVQPDNIRMEDIEARLGAVWISQEDHEQFVQSLLGDVYATVRTVEGTGKWNVKSSRGTIKATSEWGTDRRPAPDLLQSLLEQSQIQVTDVDMDGKSWPNHEETEAAQEKAEAIQERFGEWVWEDPERAARLAEEYNRRFNSIRLRDYTAEGERLSLPGLAMDFRPHQHQRTAVARIINEPAVGLFHEVGAGKTATMVIASMELKRLGLVNKPLVVVPGHMLEQFTREWLELYPQAKLLSAGSEDIAVKGGNPVQRRRFVSRAAAGDWDGIIMTQQAFKSIGVRRDTIERYQMGIVGDVRQTITLAQESDQSRSMVKKLETKLQAEEERMKKLMDTAPDDGLTFEDTGVDYLMVDEAHEFKNLRTVTNVQGAAIQGSVRATDMHLKLEYLRSHGDRVATMATGTPIANSVTEAHVMQRYLRPDLLRDAGVENFDVWAATFGETVTAIEMDAGGRLKNKTRFAKFKNVPELLRSFNVFADVKLSEDLNLKTPDYAPRTSDGERQPELVLVPQPRELAAYMKELAHRLDTISPRAQKGADNVLTVYNDGRKAALDVRMVGIEPTSETKLDYVARNTLRVWEENKDNTYDTTIGSGIPSLKAGALQLIFCDLSTPTGDGSWNAYDEMKELLVAGGMPAESIRYIHEADTVKKKGDLFRQCRNGDVAVLIGSTGKMGTGTNVQLRAKAIHHVTCPWRPADLTQRDGRIIRQGNANAEVYNFQYATSGSYDSAAWDGIQRKATMIQQVLRGRLDVREIEDVGDLALNAAQIKAATSGNPLVMEKIEADTALTKLERRRRAFERNKSSLSWQKAGALKTIELAQRKLPAVRAGAETVVPTAGEAFQATIQGVGYEKRTEAAAALRQWAVDQQNSYIPIGRQERDYGIIAELGGHQLRLRNAGREARLGTHDDLVFTVDGVPDTEHSVRRGELIEGSQGVLTRLENQVSRIPQIAENLQEAITKAERILADIDHEIDKPFRQETQLLEAKARSADLQARLQASIEPPRPTVEVREESEVDPEVEHIRRHHQATAATGAATPSRITTTPTPWMDRTAQRARGIER